MSIRKKNSNIVAKDVVNYDPDTFEQYRKVNFREVPAEYVLANIKPMEFDFLPGRRFISWDTETYATMFPSNRMPSNVVRRFIKKQGSSDYIPNDFPFCISICDGINAFVVYDTLENQFQEFKKLEELFMDMSVEKIGHNTGFDRHMIANARVNIRGRQHDTYFLVKTAAADRIAYDLFGIAKELDDGVVEFETMLKQYKTRHKVTDYRQFPRDLMTQYTCADVWNTIYAFKEYYPLIITQNQIPIYDLENSMLVVSYAMERIGFMVDGTYEHELISELEKEATDAENDIYATAGCTFNINSGKQVAAVLDDLGYGHLVSYNKDTGNPKLDKDEKARLESLGVPLITKMNIFMNATKLLNTFARKLYEMRDAAYMVHPNFNTSEAKTGRFSISAPSCFTPTTELLTTTGWIAFDKVTQDMSVAQFDKTNNCITFGTPDALIIQDYTGDLYGIAGRGIDLLTTPDHNLLIKNRRDGRLYVKEMQQFWNTSCDAHILAGGIHDGCVELSAAEIGLICMLQADGHIRRDSNRISFEFKKERKELRFKDIMCALSITYTTSIDAQNRYRHIVPATAVFDIASKYVDINKQFTWELLNLTQRSKQLFVAEVALWDGLSTRDNLHYASSYKINCDIVQAIVSLTNKRSPLNLYTNQDGNSVWQTFKCEANSAGAYYADKYTQHYSGKVYCVTVKTGFIVTRHNNTVNIVGNCQNMPRRRDSRVRGAFVAPDNYTLYDFDFKAQESIILAHYSKAERLLELMREGKDAHKATATIVWHVSYEEVTKELRELSKSIGFAIVYGAGPDKVASMTGKTTYEARRAIAEYMAGLPEVDQFIRLANRVAKKRRYINTVMNKTVYVEPGREYACVNYIIQGSAAVSTKTRMVDIYKYLKAHNLKSYMILQVHDSLLNCIHVDEEEWILGKLRWLQTERNLFDVEVKVDVAKCQPTWRNKDDVKIAEIPLTQEELNKMNAYDMWAETLF